MPKSLYICLVFLLKKIKVVLCCFCLLLYWIVLENKTLHCTENAFQNGVIRVIVYLSLRICVFVFGLRCLRPGQKFRKFNSDHFPFFKNLKRTSGAKVRSFPTLVKKWQFTPVLLLLLKDRNIKKIVKIHSLIDDHWWSLMIIDDDWWSLMFIDHHWWSLMMVDDDWWQLMMIDKLILHFVFIFQNYNQVRFHHCCNDRRF